MDPELNTAPPAADPTPADPPAAAPAPEPSLEEAALAAMDEGLATEQPAEAPAEPEAPDAEPVPGTPEAAAADAAKVAEGKAAEPAAPAADKPDEAIEKEIADRGLKDDTATRFRELANQVRELSPLKDALSKAGVKDVAELPQLAQHAQFGRELYQQVQDTGATAEQYGAALDYLSMITRATQGDMKAAEGAYEALAGELAVLGRMLGKDIPGVVDPLADHPDLLHQVKENSLPRAAALETARLRNQTALSEANKQAETKRRSSETAQQQALEQATAELNTLGAELAKIDPHYAAKAPVLIQMLQGVRADLPPARWAAAARQLYANIPNPAPAAAVAPAPAKPAPGPVRGNAVRPVVVPVTDDPMEALEQGIAAANH